MSSCQFIAFKSFNCTPVIYKLLQVSNNSQPTAIMVNTYLIISAIVAIIAVALGVAYQTGSLNPFIEKLGVYYFKMEAKAEEKKMEAQGMKEGEDFLKGGWLRYLSCLRGVLDLR